MSFATIKLKQITAAGVSILVLTTLGCSPLPKSAMNKYSDLDGAHRPDNEPSPAKIETPGAPQVPGARPNPNVPTPVAPGRPDANLVILQTQEDLVFVEGVPSRKVIIGKINRTSVAASLTATGLPEGVTIKEDELNKGTWILSWTPKMGTVEPGQTDRSFKITFEVAITNFNSLSSALQNELKQASMKREYTMRVVESRLTPTISKVRADKTRGFVELKASAEVSQGTMRLWRTTEDASAVSRIEFEVVDPTLAQPGAPELPPELRVFFQNLGNTRVYTADGSDLILGTERANKDNYLDSKDYVVTKLGNGHWLYTVFMDTQNRPVPSDVDPKTNRVRPDAEFVRARVHFQVRSRTNNAVSATSTFPFVVVYSQEKNRPRLVSGERLEFKRGSGEQTQTFMISVPSGRGSLSTADTLWKAIINEREANLRELGGNFRVACSSDAKNKLLQVCNIRWNTPCSFDAASLGLSGKAINSVGSTKFDQDITLLLNVSTPGDACQRVASETGRRSS